MAVIEIDPEPGAALSPRLYMQFMEPLGTTDSSVAAAWDFLADGWRPDFLEVVRDLAPGAIRWGGILTSYWKWREGIGPAHARRPMPNYLWGGVETNRIGVHEILGLCEAVAAEPLIGVNFAADGRPEYIDPPRGGNRAGTPEEAADLVRYCNDPDQTERAANGRREPWGVRLWQIGNETSYPPPGRRFDSRQNAATYKAFATAMRAADPGIELIGWGDREGKTGAWWAEDLLQVAGDQVDLVALHMMHQRPMREDTVLKGQRYREDYDRAWAELGEIHASVEGKLVEAREVVRRHSPTARLAITEGHLSLQPHNKCPLLREWLAGLYHARLLNLYERHADMVEVATLADFFGTNWTVNAVMLGSPRERPYLLPAGHIARLYRRHGGDRLLRARCDDSCLDVAASRRGDRVYLHVVNTDLHGGPRRAALRIDAGAVAGGTAWTIDPGTVSAFVDGTDPDLLRPRPADVPADPATVDWAFPAASVTALELELGSA